MTHFAAARKAQQTAYPDVVRMTLPAIACRKVCFPPFCRRASGQWRGKRSDFDAIHLHCRSWCVACCLLGGIGDGGRAAGVIRVQGDHWAGLGVKMNGTTPDSLTENSLGTSHSVTFTTAPGVNYKIALVNNEIAGTAFCWPNRWPIDGHADMNWGRSSDRPAPGCRLSTWRRLLLADRNPRCRQRARRRPPVSRY